MAFEPGKPEVVATCGGRFLCVFHLETGDLMMKYEHEHEELHFYSLAWTSLEMGNILATGSNTGEVRLFHLERKVAFHSFNYKKSSINAIQFHSEEPSWLLTASKVSKALP